MDGWMDGGARGLAVRGWVEGGRRKGAWEVSGGKGEEEMTKEDKNSGGRAREKER